MTAGLQALSLETSVPHLLLDDFQSDIPWTATQPDDAPSIALGLTSDPQVFRYGPDHFSGRIDAALGSTSHRLERAFGPVNLTQYDEIRFWFRSSRRSNGSPEAPFRVRIEIGSAGMPIGSPGNTWHRYVPAEAADTWLFIRLDLDDMPPAVRSDASAFRITAANSDTSWTAWIDDLIACRPGLIDADAALLDLLDGTLTLGAPVPAAVHVPGAVEPATPWIRLVQYDVADASHRGGSGHRRTDFTDDGFRVHAAARAYELLYRIDAVTPDRVEQAALLEHVLDVLGSQRTLLVNGAQLPMERVLGSTAFDAWNPAPVLRYRVITRREQGTATTTQPARHVRIRADL